MDFFGATLSSIYIPLTNSFDMTPLMDHIWENIKELRGYKNQPIVSKKKNCKFISKKCNNDDDGDDESRWF